VNANPAMRGPSMEPPRLEVVGVPGLPEVSAGDDLATAVVHALARIRFPLHDGDVLVVSSKIVAKAEGRALVAAGREAAVDDETVRVVAERLGPRGVTRIVESRSGPVLAAAGVDASNVPPGNVLLLPELPDASARRLRAALQLAAGVPLGVIVSDTAGRAWRDGQVDLAIGAAGLRVTDDLRGDVDRFGNPLEVTVRALADELASAADLVKGKLDGVPVAVVRGLAALVTPDDGPGAHALLRSRATDWFALGHVEAVRSALGVPPGSPGVPLVPLAPGDVPERLARAVHVALATPPAIGQLPPTTLDVRPTPPEAATATVGLVLPDGGLDITTSMALGGLAQRIVAAAWSEGLAVTCRPHDERGLSVTARPSDTPV
jgi:coenzyme F420-0:L-glutamate ligase/coenzyme F420-1:gamma-L-glutamate ligase